MCMQVLPLVLGLATSVIGGQMQASAARRQQGAALNQSLAASQARNAVLQRFLAQQREYQEQNRGVLNDTIGRASQPNLAGAQSAGLAGRIAYAGDAVDQGTTSNVAPPSFTGSQIAQNDLNERTAAGLGRARDNTRASATAGAYEDANAYLGNNALNAGRKIGTTNEFSRGDAGLLPSQQEFAEFMARTGNPIYPMSTWGQGIQGLGNVFASLAGPKSSNSLFG